MNQVRLSDCGYGRLVLRRRTRCFRFLRPQRHEEMRGGKWGSVCLRGIRGSRLMARHLDPDLLLTPGSCCSIELSALTPSMGKTHLNGGGRVRRPRVSHGHASSVQGKGRGGSSGCRRCPSDSRLSQHTGARTAPVPASLVCVVDRPRPLASSPPTLIHVSLTFANLIGRPSLQCSMLTTRLDAGSGQASRGNEA